MNERGNEPVSTMKKRFNRYFFKILFIILSLFIVVCLLVTIDRRNSFEDTSETDKSSIQLVDTVKYANYKKVSPKSLSNKISPDHPSPHENIWIDLNELFIVRRTVFFDERKDFGPQIVLISLHHDSINAHKKKLYALISLTDEPNDKSLCVPVSTWKQVGWVRESIEPAETWVTYLLRISHKKLTTAPHHISLSFHEDCRKSSLYPEMPVFYDKRPRTNIFAACAQKGLFGAQTNPKDIVDWVELNRALGAAIVTIQVQVNELGDQLKTALTPYINEGFVELIDWKIKINTRDYGMSASANECIYRNINRAKFVTIHDTDELLVPQLHDTWPELMDHLSKSINIDKYASFSFRNTHFYYNKEPLLITPPCPNRQIPRYFNWTLRTQSPNYVYPKVMANLDHSIAAFCHTIWKWKYGVRKEFPISPALGLSHHYRIPSKGKGEIKTDTMKRYISTVMPRIKSIACNVDNVQQFF